MVNRKLLRDLLEAIDSSEEQDMRSILMTIGQAITIIAGKGDDQPGWEPGESIETVMDRFGVK